MGASDTPGTAHYAAPAALVLSVRPSLRARRLMAATAAMSCAVLVLASMPVWVRVLGAAWVAVTTLWADRLLRGQAGQLSCDGNGARIGEMILDLTRARVLPGLVVLPSASRPRFGLWLTPGMVGVDGHRRLRAWLLQHRETASIQAVEPR